MKAAWGSGLRVVIIVAALLDNCLLPVHCVAATLAGGQQALGGSLPGSIMTEVRGIMSAQRVHCSLPPSGRLFVSFAAVLLFCAALRRRHRWPAERWRSGETGQVNRWTSLRRQIGRAVVREASVFAGIGLWIMWRRHNPMHPIPCQRMTTWLFVTQAASVTASQLC